MSAIDSMLDGDEPMIKKMSIERGPVEAALYLSLFNNACCQIAEFEDAWNSKRTDVFFAPMTNMSQVDN